MNSNLLLVFACTLCAVQIGNSLPAEQPAINNGEAPLIVGGEEAKKNEFPWLVNLKITTGNGYMLCGGSLLQVDLVLTAAHCVKDQAVKNMNITAGDHNIHVWDGTEQSSSVAAVKIHEKYNEKKHFANDIALIRLAKNFTLSNNVKTIGLPASSFNASTSAYGQVAGWGTLNSGSSNISPVLRKVYVGITNDSALCFRQNITDYKLQFCAGETGKDSCQGDSGGPFICSKSPGSVCGIVSYGDGCAFANKPGVYTQVAGYLKWINDNRVKFTSTAPSLLFSKLLLAVSLITVSIKFL